MIRYGSECRPLKRDTMLSAADVAVPDQALHNRCWPHRGSNLFSGYIPFYFFFSSRRRHTRFDCDWSSDVCSSDLVHGEANFVVRFAPASVLDGGCGTGRVGRELARRGIEVVGVDIDPQMLATARRKDRKSVV